MTNNTILNVSRELLADLLGNDHDKRIMAERHLLAMLANAPSPAGVDGLEVGDVECNCSWNPDSHDKTCPVYLRDRLSDAQAIIDGLRGEVAQLQSMLATVSKAGIRVRTDRDQQAQRIGELEGLLRHAQKQVPTGSGLHMRIDAALSAGKGVE